MEVCAELWGWRCELNRVCWECVLGVDRNLIEASSILSESIWVAHKSLSNSNHRHFLSWCYSEEEVLVVWRSWWTWFWVVEMCSWPDDNTINGITTYNKKQMNIEEANGSSSTNG
jgi:hypothetical protein